MDRGDPRGTGRLRRLGRGAAAPPGTGAPLNDFGIPDWFRAEAFDDTPAPIEQFAEEHQHRGQARIAYRLAAAHRGRLLYVRGLGWLVWDGKRWAEDEKSEATAAVLAVLRDALADSLADKDLRDDVRRSESANGVAGVLELAAAIPALRASAAELDADPWLLNAQNGTLDLRDGTLRAHDPADRITKVTNASYDPRADRREWDEFLEAILPDPEERAYLRRIVGQALYGSVREHLFPVLTGTGANGKSTAYCAIDHALGDYSTVIDPALLMAGGHTGGPEVMQLLGARLVFGSETEEGRRLDAPTMKRLTGGDPITARHLYREPVTWTPSHQLVYITNHLPAVKANDPAAWRRIRVIPFGVVIPAGDRDPELGDRLRLSADAVLTWAVEGWHDYAARGRMDEPQNVLAATDAYQADSDDLRRFIADRCVEGPYVHVGSGELLARYNEWAPANGAAPLTTRTLPKELERLGYASRRTNAGVRWQGLALAAAPQSDGW